MTDRSERAQERKGPGTVSDDLRVQTLMYYDQTRLERRRISDDAPAVPPAPEPSIKPIEWSKPENGKQTGTIDHQEHYGYKLKLTTTNPNDPNALTRVETDYGDESRNRVYEKRRVGDKDVWFQVLRDGKTIEMQGDLRANSQTGEFTQVLRRDLDGNGNGVKETTRTMGADGTDTIHRMDGSESIFRHSAKGQATEWVEKDRNNKVTTFTPTKLADGQVEWKGSDGSVRYNPTVEDNGNVTWSDKPRTKEGTSGREVDLARHVETSAGDHVVDGAGARYTFNLRGDITRIKFDRARQFEGHVVDQIDIKYRGDTRIIDGLALAQNGHWTGFMQRVATNNPNEARNDWYSYDGSGRMLVQSRQQGGQTVRLVDRSGREIPYTLSGDYAIQDGQISTTEPNVGHRFDVGGKKPELIKWTYLNVPSSTTGGGTDTSGQTKLEEVASLDIPVPGESSFGGSPSPTPPDGRSPRPTPESPTGSTIKVDSDGEENDLLRQLQEAQRLRELEKKRRREAQSWT